MDARDFQPRLDWAKWATALGLTGAPRALGSHVAICLCFVIQLQNVFIIPLYNLYSIYTHWSLHYVHQRQSCY